tara:strand:+ start:811 stop:1344 length:534 start_codon:yes stop_codon:yes gene_type:complete
MKKKRSLIPDPIYGLLDIQTASVEKEEELGVSYEVAEEITPAKIVEFHDPDLKPPEDTILTIYNNPRYGKKTLKELKKMCKDRDLTSSGTKKILIDRLDEHNAKTKLEIKKKKEEGERAVVDSVEEKKKMLKNRIRSLTRQREGRLKLLIKAQQSFDKIEVELKNLKVTLKSLDSLF